MKDYTLGELHIVVTRVRGVDTEDKDYRWMREVQSRNGEAVKTLEYGWVRDYDRPE
jgi:hypothetical protein